MTDYPRKGPPLAGNLQRANFHNGSTLHYTAQGDGSISLSFGSRPECGWNMSVVPMKELVAELLYIIEDMVGDNVDPFD